MIHFNSKIVFQKASRFKSLQTILERLRVTMHFISHRNKIAFGSVDTALPHIMSAKTFLNANLVVL